MTSRDGTLLVALIGVKVILYHQTYVTETGRRIIHLRCESLFQASALRCLVCRRGQALYWLPSHILRKQEGTAGAPGKIPWPQVVIRTEAEADRRPSREPVAVVRSVEVAADVVPFAASQGTLERGAEAANVGTIAREHSETKQCTLRIGFQL